MKRFQWLFAVAALSLTIFSTSCDPDPITNTTPSISLLADNPNPNGQFMVQQNDVTFTGDASLGSLVYFGVQGEDFPAADTDQALSSLEILLDGARITDALVSIVDDAGNAIDPPNNPQLLAAEYATSFRFEVGIRLPDAFGTYTYTFILNDTSGDAAVADESDEIAITITLEADPATPLNGELVGVLLNAGGPVGTGGLDLHTGNGTGSMDAEADIRDNGIDTNQPVNENWIQTISPVNGTTLYAINRDDLPEGWAFADVTSLEAIQDAVALAGTEVAESDVVATDNVFAVVSGTETFLLLVTDVNITPADNDDSYTFDVKY